MEVYRPTNVRKIFVPAKFWQTFKISPRSPIILGRGGTVNSSFGDMHKPAYDIKPESFLSWEALIERKFGCISLHCPRTRCVTDLFFRLFILLMSTFTFLKY